MATKTHYTYSQNSDTIAHSDRELYHLQSLLQAAGPETFGYTIVWTIFVKWSWHRQYLKRNKGQLHCFVTYR